MAGDERKPGRRAGPIRTMPLADASKVREQLDAQLSAAMSPSILVIAGPDVGIRVRLDRSIELGRDPSLALALRDESVSWRHCRIEDRGAGEWVAVDLGSTNGLLVNGIPSSESTVLKSGDKVMLGKTVLEFQLADALREGFNVEVQRLLNEDELTGLWVRRRFEGQLETTVSSVMAGGYPVVSVVVMDLDGVKAINDTHGHDLGAFVIGTAGRVMRQFIGTRGFATRFGGDEYAAAFPGMTKDETCAFAEALRQAVADHVYERQGVRVYVGMSCGVASFPGDASDAEELFKAADQAMYRAKRGGKNRVAT